MFIAHGIVSHKDVPHRYMAYIVSMFSLPLPYPPWFPRWLCFYFHAICTHMILCCYIKPRNNKQQNMYLFL